MKTETIKIKWSDPIRIEDAIQILTDEIGLYYITRTYNSKEKVCILARVIVPLNADSLTTISTGFTNIATVRFM